MRRFLRPRREPTQPAHRPKPVPDYQSQVDADAERAERERRWYEPDLRWSTNRETILGCLGSAIGELLAIGIGIAVAALVLYVIWR